MVATLSDEKRDGKCGPKGKYVIEGGRTVRGRLCAVLGDGVKLTINEVGRKITFSAKKTQMILGKLVHYYTRRRSRGRGRWNTGDSQIHVPDPRMDVGF